MAVLFNDLDPGSAGTVCYRQLADRLVITYVGVTEFSASSSNFMQAELYFDGEITITHLGVAAAVAGEEVHVYPTRGEGRGVAEEVFGLFDAGLVFRRGLPAAVHVAHVDRIAV